jgi:hypothetical protein
VSSPYLSYGCGRTRITLYAADGTTPVSRITLQKETREGLVLTFTPEGTLQALGSGASWAQTWKHRGFRPSLVIQWDAGVYSSRETWDGTSWGTADSITTAQALTLILNAAVLVPCLVQPHLDHAYTFLAQPDSSIAFALQDLKGVVHTSLSLSLLGQGLSSIPEWSA